jgi:hypothetical protein
MKKNRQAAVASPLLSGNDPVLGSAHHKILVDRFHQELLLLYHLFHHFLHRIHALLHRCYLRGGVCIWSGSTFALRHHATGSHSTRPHATRLRTSPWHRSTWGHHALHRRHLLLHLRHVLGHEFLTISRCGRLLSLIHSGLHLIKSLLGLIRSAVGGSVSCRGR